LTATLLFACWAACMPAHDEALNDRSSMPPVSVTIQPRVLPLAAAELPEPADALAAELPEVEAELWLLPQAARTTIADTASAAGAHALCFTLTSTGPARVPRLASHSSRVDPQAIPVSSPLGRGHTPFWPARCRIGTRT
jgi:hypothetical protein